MSRRRKSRRTVLRIELPHGVLAQSDVRFGYPHVSGVPTRVLAARFVAGESLTGIAADYGVAFDEVLAALRYELGAARRLRAYRVDRAKMARAVRKQWGLR